METLLVIVMVGWVITGLNLLLTFDKQPSPDVRKLHDF
jgi:hypothetical protein